MKLSNEQKQVIFQSLVNSRIINKSKIDINLTTETMKISNVDIGNSKIFFKLKVGKNKIAVICDSENNTCQVLYFC